MPMFDQDKLKAAWGGIAKNAQKQPTGAFHLSNSGNVSPGSAQTGTKANPDEVSYAQGRQKQSNPFYDVGQAGNLFYGDPRVARGMGQMYGAAENFKSGVGGFNEYAQNFMEPEAAQLQAMAAGGGPSYVNDAAMVQRQNAQGAIGQQAMMGARGALSPAAQRQAIMGASSVQANMAGQVAAARSQERMAALNGLMQARGAQLGARTTALGGDQALAGSAQAQQDLIGRQRGGVMGMGLNAGGQRIEQNTADVDPHRL